MYGVYIAMIGSLFGCYMYKNNYPANYLLLLAFTLTMAFTVGIVCAAYRSV